MTQRKSTKKNNGRTPKFHNEAEEAAWLASPAGQRASERALESPIQNRKVIVSDKRTIDEEDKKALRDGALIRYRKGLAIKRTDPAVLRKLVERVKAKQTQAVSLRIPVADIDAAKRIAARTGLGYQTVLKEIISQALRQA